MSRFKLTPEFEKDLRKRASLDCQTLLAEIDELRAELALAIAHDRQPYPTAEAYELACKAKNKYRDERNKLKEDLELVTKLKDNALAQLYPEYDREGAPFTSECRSCKKSFTSNVRDFPICPSCY